MTCDCDCDCDGCDDVVLIMTFFLSFFLSFSRAGLVVTCRWGGDGDGDGDGV